MESMHCDRRKISEIIAVLSALNIVTVLPKKIVCLNCRDRLSEPINLADIRNAVREASEQLQRLQIERQF
jgi:hypothetical protein